MLSRLVSSAADCPAQAEEVLSGARSQRNADMHVHASDAVQQRAWRAASGGTADDQEVC
jgi:hypothetical protein